MKAMAILRECSFESTQDQRRSITSYARSEGIDVAYWYQIFEDNYKDIYEKLPKLGAVIVTKVSRISKEVATLDEFKVMLHNHSVELISMYS
ncbi:recombinase family protein [Paenibacillus glycanilyticus]|uniref:recombinase family protein n=1 Tax=Paenibacillus glycanilyticus TaxID=126569 RepID=UPI00203AE3EA|nr:recombinase family protein [Paenibacillus glycanilyticus]MCM3626787.1 recombinase family protein [Paenibacillus glycanilyticus]